MATYKKWLNLVAIGFACFIFFIDFFALFNLDSFLLRSQITLPYHLYLLFFISPLIGVGGIADQIGRKKIALIGIFLLALSSLLCLIGSPFFIFIIAKIIGGIGGAMILVTSLALISYLFQDLLSKTTAIGLLSAWGILGCIVAKISLDLISIRWFFFSQIILAMISYLLLAKTIKESQDETFKGRIDYMGFFFSFLALFLLVFSVELIELYGITSKEFWYVLVLSMLMGGLFVLVEKKKMFPLVIKSRIESPDFYWGCSMVFIEQLLRASFMVLVVIYIVYVMQSSLPMYLFALFGSFFLASILIRPLLLCWKIKKWLWVSWTITGITLLVLLFICREQSKISGHIILLTGCIITSFFFSIIEIMSLSISMHSIFYTNPAMGSGLINAIRAVGIAIGILLAGLIFHQLEVAQFNALLAKSEYQKIIDYREVIEDFQSGIALSIEKMKSLPPEIAEEVSLIYHKAATHALKIMIIGLFILSMLGLLCSTRIKGKNQFIV